MQRPTSTFLSLVFIFSGAVAQARHELTIAPRLSGAYKASDQFLTSLGFKNFAKEADKTLQKPQGIHEVSLLSLKDNALFYTSLEDMKSLASLTYAYLKLNEKLPAPQRGHNLNLIVNITTQQVLPFPVIALEPVLDPKYKIARGDEAITLRENYLYARAKSRFATEKGNLLRAYTYLYKQLESSSDKNVEKFQSDLNRLLDGVLIDTYTPSEAQQNRHFGRALTAVLVKYARETSQPSLEERLRRQMKSVGLDLDNIITAKYRPLTYDPNQSSVQLKNGDLAFEFSSGQEAYFTAMGVIPGTAEDMVLAKKYDLINSYSYIPLFLADDYYNEALDRQRANLVLNSEQEKVLADYWNPYISKGYSHVGLVRVFSESKSGISLAWIYDIFPNFDFGRVRVMSPEGFAIPERNIRIGFARYNPEKMLNLFKRQIAERGYLETIFESNETGVTKNDDDVDVPYVIKDKRYKWPSKVPKSTVMDWYKNVSVLQAEEWYQKTLLPRVFKIIEESISSKDALIFANNMVSGRSSSYCSQFIKIAFLQAGNVDIAPVSDQYRSLSKLAAKYFPKKIDIDPREHLLSPNGMIWQSQLLDSYQGYVISRERVQRQMSSRDVSDLYTNYLSADKDVMAVPILITPSVLSEESIYIYDDRGS